MNLLKEYFCILIEAKRSYKDISFNTNEEYEIIEDKKEAVIDHINSVYIGKLYLEKLMSKTSSKNTRIEERIKNNKIIKEIELKKKTLKYLNTGFLFFLVLSLLLITVNVFGIYRNNDFFEISKLITYSSITFFCWVLRKSFIYTIDLNRKNLEERIFSKKYMDFIEETTKDIIKDINTEEKVIDSHQRSIPENELEEAKVEVIELLKIEKEKYIKNDKFNLFEDIKEQILEEFTSSNKKQYQKNTIDISKVK